MRHFDVGQFGPADWEGLGSDPSTGNLLVGARTQKRIYEVTTSGSLVRIIDASGISGMSYMSGVAMAPASGGLGRDYWIVDRAVDNGSNLSENDGKLFEISVGSTSTNSPPVVTNPGTLANAVGDSVSYQISATDSDGDAIPTYGASGLPTGVSVSTTTGLISGTTTTQGTFGVTITATDARGATGSASFTWTVTASGSALTFSPVADTFVGSDRPDRNFGSRSTMITDASPTRYVLLKFTVSGIGGKTIRGVKLRMYCVNGSPAGGGVYPVSDNNWQESTVTWNNQPAALATAVASLGAVSANTWYEVDVTSLVTGDGTYSVRIATLSGDAATYNSKEGTAGFESSLVVSLAS
jgi:Putative Ig domain